MGCARGTAPPATLQGSAGRESFACQCANLSPSQFFILPRDSGEGGPSVCAVEGASASTIFLRRQRSSISDAPSTALRAVPLPRYRGGGQVLSFSRCAFASEFCHATARKPFHIPPQKGGGAPAGASTGKPHRRPVCPVRANPVGHAARALFSFLPRLRGRIKEGARSPLGAPPRLLGPGPRFLEPPGANGRTLPGTSAASTSQSGHAPDRPMPRTARKRSVSLHPLGPLPLRLRSTLAKASFVSGICVCN
jgi:hypothetical protein